MIRISLILAMILLLAACTQNLIPSTPDGTMLSPSKTAQVTETREIPISPTKRDATQMIQPLPTPADASLQSLIEKTREDLAQRLSISANQINLVEAMEVEWSDSSLECPQPGMDYLQVITPGYRILLEAGGQEYEYHSNRDAYVIYCENPVPPFLPKP